MQEELLIRTDKKSLIHAPIGQVKLSRFNPRRSRSAEKVSALALRIQRNGFEITRALWAYRVGDVYEVFAGGTRLEAARAAGITEVPIVLHEGFSDDQIARLADEDNENDEYHEHVSLVDIWAEYWRLNKEEGWTARRIGEAKGLTESQAALRVRLHEQLPQATKKATVDGLFDEGHAVAILGVTVDINSFSLWLTTSQAQTELTQEVLGKHRGSTAGIKPTVSVVRAAAKRWKEMISEAERVFALVSEEWQECFVALLVESKARNSAAVQRSFSTIATQQAEAAKLQEEELLRQQGAAAAERLRLEQEAQQQAKIASIVAKARLGDAREFIQSAPTGFSLLLTDPPYGKDYQSNRRTTTAKKDSIAFDDSSALALLGNVLKTAYGRMATDSHALIFTDWQSEPDFRRVVQESGFTVKGSLVWVKNNHGTGDLLGSFAPRHERIIHAVKGCPRLNGRPDDVLYGKDRQNSEHPTEKPLDLLKILVEATTEPGAMVLDPFAGSGNTLFAALETGRDFEGYEIEERWHRLITDGLHQRAVEMFKREIGGDGSQARANGGSRTMGTRQG